MKFTEELELANGRLEEAKRLHQQTMKELIPVLFDEIKDLLYSFNNKPLYKNILHGEFIPLIKAVKNHTDMDLMFSKNFVFDNKDIFIKLADEYYNNLLSKDE